MSIFYHGNIQSFTNVHKAIQGKCGLAIEMDRNRKPQPYMW